MPLFYVHPDKVDQIPRSWNTGEIGIRITESSMTDSSLPRTPIDCLSSYQPPRLVPAQRSRSHSISARPEKEEELTNVTAAVAAMMDANGASSFKVVFDDLLSDVSGHLEQSMDRPHAETVYDGGDGAGSAQQKEDAEWLGNWEMTRVKIESTAEQEELHYESDQSGLFRTGALMLANMWIGRHKLWSSAAVDVGMPTLTCMWGSITRSSGLQSDYALHRRRQLATLSSTRRRSTRLWTTVAHVASTLANSPLATYGEDGEKLCQLELKRPSALANLVMKIIPELAKRELLFERVVRANGQCGLPLKLGGTGARRLPQIIEDVGRNEEFSDMNSEKIEQQIVLVCSQVSVWDLSWLLS